MKSKLLFLALISFFTANAQYTGANTMGKLLWEKTHPVKHMLRMVIM